MARSWRDYRSPDTAEAACDNSDIRDKSPPNVPNVTNVTGLGADVQRGLMFLANAPAPSLASPEVWPEVVADALRLASEGWAERAASLGWSSLDLFGAMKGLGDDPGGDGLAVCLAGRKLLALDAQCAVLADASGNRFFFHRPRAPGAVLLWALGRGRG